MTRQHADGDELGGRSTRQLLALWGAILRELRRRGVVRTANNPIGDIAEALVAAHVGGERASFSNRGWDVKGPDGALLEVKGIRIDEVATRKNLSPIPATSEYTRLVVVVFDADLRVAEALEVDRAVIEEFFNPRKKDGARIVRLTQKFKADPRVRAFELSDSLLDHG